MAPPTDGTRRSEASRVGFGLKKWHNSPPWSSTREEAGRSPWQVGQQCPGLRAGSGQGMGGHFMGTQRTRLLCNAPIAVLPLGLAPRDSRMGHRVGMEGESLRHQASESM